MKIKTSELTGAALDWIVSIYEETEPPQETDQRIKYSSDWLWGGPIIEGESMQVFNYAESSPNEPWFVEKNHFGRHHKAGRSYASGPTILIAAMRCYVSVKLGDEVDIPKEML